jgi:hypothetical protein
MSNTIFEKALVLDKTPGKMAPLAHKFYKGKYYHEIDNCLYGAPGRTHPLLKERPKYSCHYVLKFSKWANRETLWAQVIRQCDSKNDRI